MSGVGVQDVKFPKKSIKSCVKNSCNGKWLGQKGNKIPIYRGKKPPKGNEHHESRDEGLWRWGIRGAAQTQGQMWRQTLSFWTGAHLHPEDIYTDQK